MPDAGKAEAATMMVTALHRRLRGTPFVTRSVDVLRRVILAYARGAGASLIAAAEVIGGKLLVWSCEPRLYECPIADVPSLAELSVKSLLNFTVSASGSRIHWPDGDVDLDLDTIRYHADPAFRAGVDKQARRRAQRYGRAIRLLREDRGIRQTEIPGLTDREVRRLEAGDALPHSATLTKLATAHKMVVEAYLEALARLESVRHRTRQSRPRSACEKRGRE
jgi:hypothetical protein